MEYQANWEHNFIDNNGVKIHYVTQGEGKLMLMLHGFPAFWYSWRHQIPEFSENYKVVAVDLRGHNDSDKPKNKNAYRVEDAISDVKAVIEGLGYESCVLVGHNRGGAVAWEFAYTHPEMVEQLIVMNAPHLAKIISALRTPQQLLRSWYFFLFQLPWLPEALFRRSDYQFLKGGFTNFVVDKDVFSPSDLEIYKEAAAKPGALTAMVNWYRNFFQSWLVDRGWGVLKVPTLMIWGEEDAALGKELVAGTENYVENLTVRYVPGCGHWVHEEKPQLVNQYMHEFLASAA